MGKRAPGSELDWNDLRYFLAAVRGKTLAGAARTLGVEHSTIGRRLTALEEAMGAPLLTRGPDGVTLTALGEKAVPLVEGMAQAAHAVAELVAATGTRVRLATPSGFGRYINPHLAAFQLQHPEITIELLSGSRPVDLKRSEADLALRAVASDDEELIAKKVGDVAWSMYAAPAYCERHGRPSDPRALAGHEVLGFENTLAGVPGARFLDEHGAGAHVIMRCREMTDVLAACAAGLGLAVVPCMAAQLEPALVRVTDEVLGWHRLFIVYRKEVLVSPPIRAVIAFLSDVFAQYGPRLAGLPER